MDGKAYVASLQRVWPRPHFPLPAGVAPFTDLDTYVAWFRGENIDPAVNRLPHPVPAQIQRIPVTMLPVRTLNAQTFRAPNGDPVVVIHDGLQEILHSYMATYLRLTDLAGPTHATTAIAGWASFARAVLDHLGGREKPLQDMRFSIDDPMDFMDRDACCTGAELFVWLHEYAHVHLGHRSGGAVRDKPVPGRAGTTVASFQQSQQQELDADRQAFTWYLRAAPHFERLSILTPHRKIISPLHFLCVAGTVEALTGSDDGFSTHPPALRRMAGLIALMPRESQKAASSLARVGTAIAQNVTHLIRT